MSFINLTPYERSILLEGILESDKEYLEELIQRKVKLLIEYEFIEQSIRNKTLEIQNTNEMLMLIEKYH